MGMRWASRRVGSSWTSPSPCIRRLLLASPENRPYDRYMMPSRREDGHEIARKEWRMDDAVSYVNRKEGPTVHVMPDGIMSLVLGRKNCK